MFFNFINFREWLFNIKVFNLIRDYKNNGIIGIGDVC